MPNIITIRNFAGQVLGTIETDAHGNKTVKDFYNRVLGYYKKDYDITTDFYGRTIARGDAAASLISLAQK